MAQPSTSTRCIGQALPATARHSTQGLWPSERSLTLRRCARVFAAVGTILLSQAIPASAHAQYCLYVGSSGPSSGDRVAHLARIDAATLEVSEIGEVGVNRPVVRAHPDGRHLVIATDRRLVVIDAPTDEVTQTITIPGAISRTPVDLRISADGVFAFVAVLRRIQVVDLQVGTLVADWSTDAETGGMAISQPNGVLYAGFHEGLWAIDALAPAILRTLAPGVPNPLGLALEPDGRHLLVAGDRTLRVDIGSGAVVTEYQLPDPAPDGRTFTQDVAIVPCTQGSCSGDLHALFTRARPDAKYDHYLMSVATGQVLWQSSTLDFEPFVAVTPDGATAFLTGGRGYVFAVDLAKRTRQRIEIPRLGLTGRADIVTCTRTTGAVCSVDAQCESTHCAGGFCCESACDQPGQICSVPGYEGQCLAVDLTPTPTATPPPMPTAAANGRPCDADLQCASGHCSSSICCDRACDSENEFCTLAGSVGTCVSVTLPTRTGIALPSASATPDVTEDATPTSTLTRTPSMPPSSSTPVTSCPGDCDGDHVVTVSELIEGVRMSLGQLGVDRCGVLDRDGNAQVTVDELIAAVQAALAGCR